MTQRKISLAAPYSHESAKVRDKRAAAIRKAHAQLIAGGHLVYSPICHTHAMATDPRLKMPTDYQFWQASCEWFISMCDILLVLQLPGWHKSVGVLAEIEIARKLGVAFVHRYPDRIIDAAESLMREPSK